jgi:lipopolysaccharide/colanic/teichoic acid biosynthesis glycosyltransferase
MESLVAKRSLDLMVGSLALVLVSPAFLLCMLAVWVESGGPVFFKQTRLGLNGKLFNMLKFRSMFVNSVDLRNADGSTYNGLNDPRVTRVGSWLRKFSLDELPQLINVIRGDMSIVGPRPDVPDAINKYRDEDHVRLSVMPGMTGWAQIHGRNSLPWERRRDLDLEYVQKHTFWMDLWIVLQTIPVVLLGRGIYIEKSENRRGGDALSRKKLI